LADENGLKLKPGTKPGIFRPHIQKSGVFIGFLAICEGHSLRQTSDYALDGVFPIEARKLLPGGWRGTVLKSRPVREAKVRQPGSPLKRYHDKRIGQ
jgi:hypothetical protein